MDRHFFISLSRCFLFSHLGLIPKTTLLLAHNTKASTWTACDKSGIEANLIQTVGDSFPCLLLSSRHFLLSRHRRLSISIDRPQSVCRSMVAATQFFFPSCFTIYLFPSLNNSVLTIIKAPPSICHQHFSVSISRRLCSRLPLRLRYHYQGTTMLISSINTYSIPPPSTPFGLVPFFSSSTTKSQSSFFFNSTHSRHFRLS